MPRRVVIDSGPIIALFDKDDHYHSDAIAFIEAFRGELITNFAVVTEVTHLLDFNVQTQADFLKWILDGGISIVEIICEDLYHVVDLIHKYSDLPIDFADATLVALCERMTIKEIASIDKDFSIYRFKGKKGFKNVFFTK